MFSDNVDNVVLLHKPEYRRLIGRIHNQRKVIKSKHAKIENLAWLLKFHIAKNNLGDNEYRHLKLVIAQLKDDYDQIARRYEMLSHENADHLKKLIALHHVLDRDGSNIALR